jgi:hypothetical protein
MGGGKATVLPFRSGNGMVITMSFPELLGRNVFNVWSIKKFTSGANNFLSFDIYLDMQYCFLKQIS